MSPSADEWPRCFGRYADLERAEKALAFQRQGALIWALKYVGGSEKFWALMAFPYYMAAEVEKWPEK
jgi:hypothetical protein